MKILILGVDGYLGKPLSMHLRKRGHTVLGLDNYTRRERAKSLIPLGDRLRTTVNMSVHQINLKYFDDVDTIVHLAEQPSAPWSMIDSRHAVLTQQGNVIDTLSLLWTIRDSNPDAHLLKLGTMGEYGYDHGVEVPEGFIDQDCIHPHNENFLTGDSLICPYADMPFPRQGGSFYHLSKSMDSMNIEFCCKTWGLRSTDIMQGIVYGLNYWDDSLTRFDYDQYFGTVINRFAVQAIAGVPLTVYGAGGQTRSFLPLQDSIECLTLALENPPDAGEYRVFNQYAEILSVQQMAEVVQKAAESLKIDVSIKSIPNPRAEKESHEYATSNDKLRELGYIPKFDTQEEVTKLIETLLPFKDRIDQSVIMPTTKWR